MTAHGEAPLLDWRSSRHWAHDPRPCRYCDQSTQLRDSKGSAAHKTCAEDALVVQAAEEAAAYRAGSLR